MRRGTNLARSARSSPQRWDVASEHQRRRWPLEAPREGWSPSLGTGDPGASKNVEDAMNRFERELGELERWGPRAEGPEAMGAIEGGCDRERAETRASTRCEPELEPGDTCGRPRSASLGVRRRPGAIGRRGRGDSGGCCSESELALRRTGAHEDVDGRGADPQPTHMHTLGFPIPQTAG